jgi:SRSO17 transposase
MLTFEKLFRSYRKDVSNHARLYIQGLLNPNIRKTVEDIAEVVPDGDVQNLQQFITSSKWSASAVIEHVALNVNTLIGDSQNTSLIIDESGFPKKGKHSVGVSRQWLGCLGKTDNGQVGVYAALSNKNKVSLINTRLYLPQCWIDDPERCKKAGIPQEQLYMRDKEELAIEMIDEAINQKLQFGWVATDAGYGKGLWFMQQLENRGLQFAVDIHRDMRIYTEKPQPFVPEKKEGRGRQPTEYVVDQKPIRVDEWASKLKSTAWAKITVRDSTKGPLQYEVTARRVYIWIPESKDCVKQWWLVVRRNPESHDDYKYTLVNAPENVTVERLAYMQGQRYWIEHAIEVAKGQCGMADYEVRSWNGWHHHMALVMMAQLFLLTETIKNEESCPLLSPKDILLLLAHFLPKRESTIEDIVIEMKKRHKQRERTKASAVKKIRQKLSRNNCPQ